MPLDTLENQIAQLNARVDAIYQMATATNAVLDDALKDIAHLKMAQQQAKRGPGRPPKTEQTNA